MKTRVKEPLPSSVPVFKTGPRILLVDDDPSLLLLMARALETTWSQAQVATAADAVGALRKIWDLKPDVVAIDTEIPAISAREFCRWIRRSDKLAQTRILAVISSARAAAGRQAARENEADGLLVKPFDSASFIKAIARLAGSPREPLDEYEEKKYSSSRTRSDVVRRSAGSGRRTGRRRRAGKPHRRHGQVLHDGHARR